MSKHKKNKKTILFFTIVILIAVATFAIYKYINWKNCNEKSVVNTNQIKDKLNSNEKVEKIEETREEDTGITKEEAENIALSTKDKENKKLKVKYMGKLKVPYSHIDESYKKFPKEILNKQVYVFELSEIINDKTDEAVCVGQYYVDSHGDVYKDTYFMNLECVKVNE
ncbi:regulatory protein YycI of two-component signal transduction system YycFG [Clostridium tetanomorphum]|uniref:Membrane associated protein n=1 Tax=Clostridium tetanomorphum TaxID=1553 RepID=A0A923EAS8_CLOTT|nr:hypothetical protein [Clostridium tetanomorphum]KAJ49893.1 membrane associated protein [Clostridium tetanomorphum DSM 665]MBC2397831.1 hypothetical protein [Clostridium tetanomorphum]MBP1864566.1 regulatory protein YycI of two-component signal transduction system YycFG [Clostridium tetanomorphum]NRS84035.1 regulatory protein YycI of two-component signal transduction system YycFG [Clostridium tetanomorphum]NRZ97250.1 regulatory protein YycI of two-component signal transduction system YycFG [